MTLIRIFTFLLLVINLPAQAQRADTTIVEEAPEYPGGTNRMNELIYANMKYPQVAVVNGIYGRVTARFVIDTNGTMQDVQIVKSVHPLLDSEMVRVLKALPRWKPGRQNGKAVKVYLTQPIVFKISNVVGPVWLDETTGFFMGDRKAQFDTFPSREGLEQALTIIDKSLPRGMVSVLATINEDGTITRTRIVGDAKNALKQPALYIVKSLEQGWTPATKDGHKVACEMVLPLRFKKR